MDKCDASPTPMRQFSKRIEQCKKCYNDAPCRWSEPEPHKIAATVVIRLAMRDQDG